MMRVTNNMIVTKSKTNINANRAQVDRTNNQMAIQKKIVKPSDNPIIAIRSLRLRSELSTITQYYGNNIPDAESWMGVTETALVNMKDVLTKAYEQTVYGTTDSLNQENRKAILKDLQALQEQVYSEGNTDYAGRTVFTGYKTNQMLTFMNSTEAQKAAYQITERFDYKNIEQKTYYPNNFKDTSTDALFAYQTNEEGEEIYDDNGNPIMAGPDNFTLVPLNRVRTSYDKAESAGAALTFVCDNGVGNVDVKYSYDTALNSTTVNVYGFVFSSDENGAPAEISSNDYYIERYGSEYLLYNKSDLDEDGIPKEDAQPVAVAFEADDGYELYSANDYEEGIINLEDVTEGLKPEVKPIAVKPVEAEDDSGSYFGHWQVQAGNEDTGFGKTALGLNFRVSDTIQLEKEGYSIPENAVVFDKLSGELIFSDTIANAFNAQQAVFRFGYEKKGFETGELRPENYFDCVEHLDDRDIVYKNYGENDVWKTEGIFYNIAGGQEMQINTEARDAFNSDIRRDMDEMIMLVQNAIDARATVDDIKAKIASGMYDEEPAKKKILEDWLIEADKQAAHTEQNMHDAYSNYITRFKGYLENVNLAIADIGGRSERVSMTKNRMSVQQSTFKELKSSNEDMDLSDLVINYSAASVAYQAALQAAAKIDQMSLLNYL